MRNLTGFVALLIAVGWTNSSAAAEDAARYSLEVRDIKGDDSNKMVSLRDNKLKRVLWERSVYGQKITWSKNRRAVVVEDITHFLVWREGHALRDLGVIEKYDYTMGCVWSPDNRRLLIRFGMSGMSDADAGRLFCLRLEQGKNYHYSHIAGGVREMKWRDSRTVLYRLLNYETWKVSQQYQWRVR